MAKEKYLNMLTSSKNKTRDSMTTGKNHGDFRLVNGQVGRDGSVSSLLLEDFKGLSISGRNSRQRSNES